MAHKKGVGSTDNGRDSKSKRLGVKLFGGQQAVAGNILVRQRGTKFHPGLNVYMGRDHTLHAAVDGVVVYTKGKNDRRFVSIQPTQQGPVVPPVTPPFGPAPEPEIVIVDPPGVANDDLKIIEGVGPKIAEILNDAGINTFAQLAETEVDKLREILDAAGSRYKAHNPGTWPAQAKLAAEGKWDELKAYQAELVGGVQPAEETPAPPPAPDPVIDETPVVEEEPASDDLKRVEGIGPKIAEILQAAGIRTFAQLAETEAEKIREILEAAGPKFNVHDPNTWPAQAKLAAEGNWDELKKLQDELVGGRDTDDTQE